MRKLYIDNNSIYLDDKIISTSDNYTTVYLDDDRAILLLDRHSGDPILQKTNIDALTDKDLVPYVNRSDFEARFFSTSGVITVKNLQDGPVRTLIGQSLDEVGDNTGNRNMAVDGSITPVIFKIKPPAGQVYRIARLITAVRDEGIFDSGGWGNNGGSPLPVGHQIRLSLNDGGTIVDLVRENIRSHFDLAAISYDISQNSWGSGDSFVVNRYTFTKSGQYLRLVGDNNDELQVVINDDLTYLTDMRVNAQGYIE